MSVGFPGTGSTMLFLVIPSQMILSGLMPDQLTLKVTTSSSPGSSVKRFGSPEFVIIIATATTTNTNTCLVLVSILNLSFWNKTTHDIVMHDLKPKTYFLKK